MEVCGLTNRKFSARKLKFLGKKSQAWGLDLVIASSIFLMTFVIFFIYSTNHPGEAKEIVEDLSYEGKILSNSLLSEGYPIDWDENNVINIGFLTDGKINQTKLKMFYELARDDYEKTRVILKTRYDYYFFLSQPMNIEGVGEVDGIGKPGTDRNNIDSRNIIKISRFVIYEDKPVSAYIYIWER